jgi:hypothetical protein
MRKAPIKLSLRNQVTEYRLPLQRLMEEASQWVLAGAVLYVGYQALKAAVILSRAGVL